MATRRPRLQVKPNIGGRPLNRPVTSTTLIKASTTTSSAELNVNHPSLESHGSTSKNNVQNSGGGGDSIGEAIETEPLPNRTPSRGDLGSNESGSQVSIPPSGERSELVTGIRDAATKATDGTEHNLCPKKNVTRMCSSDSSLKSVVKERQSDSAKNVSLDKETESKQSEIKCSNKDRDSTDLQISLTLHPRTRHVKFKPNVSTATSANQATPSQYTPRHSRAKPILHRGLKSNASTPTPGAGSSKDAAPQLQLTSPVSSKDAVDQVHSALPALARSHLPVTNEKSSEPSPTDKNTVESVDILPLSEKSVQISNQNRSDDVREAAERRTPASPTKQPRPFIRRFSKVRPNVKDGRSLSSSGASEARTESEIPNCSSSHTQQTSGQVLSETEPPVQTAAPSELQTHSRSQPPAESSNKVVDKRQLAKMNETKELMAQKRKQFTRRKNTPDRSKLTMMDLIYWNPPDNPIKNEDAALLHSNEVILDSDMLNESTDPSADARLPPPPKTPSEKEIEDDIPGPRVRVGENGEIILDEESLVIKRPKKDTVGPVVYENSSHVSYKSFRQMTARSKRWSQKETARFYKALSIIGTDFTLISQLFPNRSRAELKKKFKYEERVHRGLVDNVINHSLHFDICNFDDDSLSEDSGEESELQSAVVGSAASTGERAKTYSKGHAGRSKSDKRQQKRLLSDNEDGEFNSPTLTKYGIKDAIPPPKARPKRNVHKKTYSTVEYDTESTMDSVSQFNACENQEETLDNPADNSFGPSGDGKSNPKQNGGRFALLASAKPLTVIPDKNGELASLLQLPTVTAPPSVPSLETLSEPSTSTENSVRGQLVFMRSETPGHEAVVHIYLIAPSQPQVSKGSGDQMQSKCAAGTSHATSSLSVTLETPAAVS